MMQSSPDDILQECGRSLGIAGLSFDEHGYCCLSFDEILVNIERDLSSREFLFYIDLAPLAARPEAETLLDLLQANHYSAMTGAGTLGLDRAASRWYLSARLRFDALGQGGLAQWLQRFLERAESWRRIIAGRVGDAAGRGPAANIDLQFIRI